MANSRIDRGGWLAIGLGVLGGLIAIANEIVRFRRSGAVDWGHVAIALGVPIPHLRNGQEPFNAAAVRLAHTSMSSDSHASDLRSREAPLEIHGDAFRTLGRQLVDDMNDLNEELINRLQRSGEAFVSNAVVQGKYSCAHAS